MAVTTQEDRVLTTAQVRNRLRDRFAPPGYGFLTEVGNGTGANHSRWADALAMSLWPSRGLEIIGIEIKTSRTDWKKERDDPEKAEAVCKFCDRWYLAVGDKRIVQPGELPPTWGLLVPFRDTMKIEVEAPQLSPVPLNRQFVAAIFRRCCEQSVDEKLLQEKFNEGFKNGKESTATASLRSQKYLEDDLEKLRAKVKDFEQASGVSISERWSNAKEIGEAVRTVLNGDHKSAENRLKNLRHDAALILSYIDDRLGKDAE